MNAISQVFWEDTLENGTVSHVAGQAGSPWSVLISLNAHGMNSLTASHLDILNCTSCHMGLFCWIVPIRTKAVPNFCLFQTHKQYSEQHALSKQTARLFFDFRTDLKNKTRQLIWSLHWRNSRANRKWGTNKAYTNGQRTSLRTRSQCFPSKVLCPDWNSHIPRVERAFLGNSKPVCISHLFDYSALRGETGFLSEHRRPSQPIISVLEICWTSSNRPHPVRDAALLLNGLWIYA